MSAGPLLALALAIAAFGGLLLHLRWDVSGTARLGALPLDDSFPSLEDTHER